MKFTVSNEGKQGFEIETDVCTEEKADYKGYLMDSSAACAAMLIELTKDCSSLKQANELIECMYELIRETVDFCLPSQFGKNKIKVFSLKEARDLGEGSFQSWIDDLAENYDYGISNESDFIEKYSGRELTLAYCLNDFDEVDIFFWVDEGTDEMEDLEILCFPIETFDEDRAEFEAVCDYCEMVAIVALDKLYGKQNNPMRKDGIRILAEDIAEGIRMRRATSGS